MREPRPRDVSLSAADAVAVCSAFGIGAPVDVSLAARGWVSLNVVWRVATELGVFAVKEVTRDTPDELEEASKIEHAGIAAGVAAPTIVRSTAGAVWASVGGRTFRCHEFLDGKSPASNLSPADAAAAGASLGTLHRLELPWAPCLMPQTTFGLEHWAQLIEGGRRAGAAWVGDLAAALPGILEAEEAAAAWREVPRRWIGSHRDIRPDNAIRTAGGGLALVDWDGAGPVVQSAEVRGALRWWAPHQGEFLDAYTRVAGDVDLSEGDCENGGLVWWLETNVRHALALLDDEERAWAVSALASNFCQQPQPPRGATAPA